MEVSLRVVLRRDHDWGKNKVSAMDRRRMKNI